MSVRLLLFGACVTVVGCTKPVSALSGLWDESTESDSGDASIPAGSDDDTASIAPVIEMTREGMVGHLEALMAIATEHGGNRAAGTEGYAASVAYVTEKLEAAGYTVGHYDFDFDTEEWNAPPSLSAGRDFVMDEDFAPFAYTGSGTVTAEVEAVDVSIPPPGGENTTDSGCQEADFSGFSAGRIALLQRGSCTFQEKVDHAVAAGATAVLIFNEGQGGRQDLFAGTLESESDNPVPVFALSYTAGVELAELDAGSSVTVSADYTQRSVPTVNVFAETAGDADRAVVVGAHLDSVVAGPGINDNGSGVAMILEMAEQVAASDWEPTNQIRFMFWGAEEIGLLGSMDYVMSMSDEEHGRIMANLNFDMIASPNPARMVYDGSGSLGGAPGPEGSTAIEQIFADWFDAYGLVYQETPFDGRSDYGPFIWTGIPAGGLFTGAEAIKTHAEADAYGGAAMQAYDPCYHQGCDTIENLDLDVLDELAEASAYSVVQLGAWGGPLTDGPSGPPIEKEARTRVQSDWVPSSCGAGPKVWRR